LFTGYRFKLILNGEEYRLKMGLPEQRYSLFDKTTWGQFQYKLVGKKDILLYSFKSGLPTIVMGEPPFKNPVVASVSMDSNHLLLALLGVYLIKKDFEYNRD
jgi:hypothetical protein